MSRERYDEMQIASRNRIATQSLALCLALVLLTAWLGDARHVWPSYLQQALVVLFITMGFFACRAIWSHAYLNPTRGLGSTAYWIIVGAIVVLSLGTIIVRTALGKLSLWGGGHLTDAFSTLIMGLTFAAIGVTAFVRHLADRRVPAE